MKVAEITSRYDQEFVRKRSTIVRLGAAPPTVVFQQAERETFVASLLLSSSFEGCHGMAQCMVQEGNMGEWTTVYEDEIEGRPVTVKVYQSDEVVAEDQNEGPAVRITTTSVDEYPGVLEEVDGDDLLIEREGQTSHHPGAL